jgi:serine/threonine protein kinase
LRLLEQFAADRDRGGLHDVAHYQARFPGHDHEVLTEWQRWTEPSTDEAVTVGPYRLERALGQGGQGIVYQAVDTRLGRRVALKLMHAPVLSRSKDGPPRLLAREVEALTRVDDPRIATVFEAGVDQGRAFLAMRLVQGPSLRELLGRWRRGDDDSPPSPTARLRLGSEIVRAVASAHERGIVHRDLKPGNVLLEHSEHEAGDTLRPVLIDFGLARALDSEISMPRGHTITGDRLGTPAYMSPERLNGTGHDDPRADVWALGVLLYELVTLRSPFEGSTFEAVARRIERDDVPRIGAIAFGRRRDLEALLQRALEKLPSQRYADATALADDVTRLLDGRPIAARPVGTLGRTTRWAGRNPARAAILLLLLAIAVGASWSTWRLDHLQREERAARERATASLRRSESDRAHLLLESDAPGRFAAALAHLEQALQARGPDDLTTRSDLVRTLTGTDLVPRETLAIGGLGIVKIDPTASVAAARCVSPETRELELTLHALGNEDAPSPAGELPMAFNLLAAHRDAIAIAERDRLMVVPLRRTKLGGSTMPAFRIDAPATTAPTGTAAHDFAAFDAAGHYLVAADGRAWTLHRTRDGAAVATGTCKADLGNLASFSEDGRWFVVRDDETSVFVLDHARAPIKVATAGPIVQAVPFVGERARLLLLQAKPTGLELGIWHAPETDGGAGGQATYTRLAIVAGAVVPPPAVAVHAGRWVAAVTASELVVVDAQQARVRARCGTGGGHAVESLAFRGNGPHLEDLELFVHRRSEGLRRFGFAQRLDWMLRREDQPTLPFARARQRLRVQFHDDGTGGQGLTLPHATIAFDGGNPLGLAVTGALFCPPTGALPNDVVDTPRGKVGAALLGVVRRRSIETHAHVWFAGEAAPHYSFEICNGPGGGAVALSDDGRQLAVVTVDDRLQLHDVHAARPLFDVSLEVAGIGRTARELAFRGGALWLRTTHGHVWEFALARLEDELARRGVTLGR